jgi:predicted TIM-barrel fold metal-dependent hydrolase
MSDGRTLELIRAWGAERVLFGSDYPMWTPADELAVINRIALTGSEREKILHGNIEKLLKL